MCQRQFQAFSKFYFEDPVMKDELYQLSRDAASWIPAASAINVTAALSGTFDTAVKHLLPADVSRLSKKLSFACHHKRQIQ